MATRILALAALGALALRIHSWAPSDQTARFSPVSDEASLDEWFATSRERPVILFLHDPGCPISGRAYRQMSTINGEIPLVDVRRNHALSRAIEARTGIRHESPQVIVLDQGQPIWSASHYAITADAVEDALPE